MIHYYKSFECIDDDNNPQFVLLVFDDEEADRLPTKDDWTQFFLNLDMNKDFAQDIDPIKITFEEFRATLNQEMIELMEVDEEDEYSMWFMYTPTYRDYKNNKIVTMPSAFFYEMPSDYLNEQ